MLIHQFYGLQRASVQGIRQLVRFNAVGVVNTLIDFGMFYLLTNLAMPYLYAQTCSYGCGVANSYIMNKYWTFQTAGRNMTEMVRFIAVNLISLAGSVLFIYLLHALLGLPLMPAKVGATLVIMAAGFLGNKLWVFKANAPSIGS